MGIYAMEVPYILFTYQFPAEFEIEVKENEIKEHGVTCYTCIKIIFFQNILFMCDGVIQISNF